MGHAFQRRLAGRSGACRVRRFLTADKNIQYQQNLGGRRIAVVVLSTPQWPLVRLHTVKIVAAVNAAMPGSYVEVQIP